MGLLYLVVALLIQGAFTNHTSSDDVAENRDVLKHKPDFGKEEDKDAQIEWIDFFPLPDTSLYPTSSVSMMTHAATSDKPIEEQLEEIKEVAHKITLAIQSEMANLLSYALSTCENHKGDNNLRKKRSAETPMDSTQLINRLLKHIKSNNEFQNIAIDKMMTAQEIADKYGIEFRPDTEIISDLAFAANQHAKEMNDLLKNTIESRNMTRNVDPVSDHKENETYYLHQCPAHIEAMQTNALPHREQKPIAQTTQPSVNHYHYSDSYPNYNYFYNSPYETQIPPPPTHNHYNPPVSKRPNFYDAVSYTPEEFYPYCSMEPMSMGSSVVPSFEELLEPEPELVGEEFEETITSKVYVDRGDEPGSATVNHVMTYTVGEKSHFKTPEIERLPQQFQYCFFLI